MSTLELPLSISSIDFYKNTYLRSQQCYLFLLSELRCLFFDKRFRALNSEDVRFSSGSWSLEKFWYQVSAVSSSLKSCSFIT